MKNPKVAIHDRPTSFSDRWREYCIRNNVTHSMIDCLDTGIISRLSDFDMVLFHWHHDIPPNVVAARHVIYAAEKMGLLVFPDIATCWTYDDKVSQKYLLEAVGAPLVGTNVFFDYETAMAWIDNASFPKVFKLRKGAGSRNVRLVKDKVDAARLVRRAFGAGFRPVAGHARDAIGKMMSRKTRRALDLTGKIRRLPQSLLNIYRSNKYLGRELGYVYFQDFVPNNSFDTRITVIGNRAFGFTRNVREKDFRASGSGDVVYDLDRVNMDCVAIAFDVAKRLCAQSIAFDFVSDAGSCPKIVEISYCYVAEAVHQCSGCWDSRLAWHDGQIWPQDAIIEDLLRQFHDGKDERI